MTFDPNDTQERAEEFIGTIINRAKQATVVALITGSIIGGTVTTLSAAVAALAPSRAEAQGISFDELRKAAQEKMNSSQGSLEAANKAERRKKQQEITDAASAAEEARKPAGPAMTDPSAEAKIDPNAGKAVEYKEQPYPPVDNSYTFTTIQFSNTLGIADLTGGIEYIAPNDPRFTQASKAVFANIRQHISEFHSAEGVMPPSLAAVNNSGLSPQERASVLGATILFLRSHSPLYAGSPRYTSTGVRIDDPQQMEGRTAIGGTAVAKLLRYFPEAKDIEYKWVRPTDPNIRRDVRGSGVTAAGTVQTGTLGDFLASAVQSGTPSQPGSFYPLLDEAFSRTILSFIDKGK